MEAAISDRRGREQSESRQMKKRDKHFFEKKPDFSVAFIYN